MTYLCIARVDVDFDKFQVHPLGIVVSASTLEYLGKTLGSTVGVFQGHVCNPNIQLLITQTSFNTFQRSFGDFSGLVNFSYTELEIKFC